MCDSKVLHLKFVGMDSWDRPVYKDDMGTLWKDVDPRARMKPDLCMGLRRSEINGLKYSDVDYVNHTLTVRRQLGEELLEIVVDTSGYFEEVPL